jgi:hypothetical protein
VLNIAYDGQVRKMSAEENTKIMNAESYAVYQHKVNEWIEETTPLTKTIEDKKARNVAEFNLMVIGNYLTQMEDSALLETKDIIQRIGRNFPVGVWPFQRGKGSSLPAEQQTIVDGHLTVATEFWGQVFDMAQNIDGANRLSILRLSGRDTEAPYAVIADKDSFVSTKVNAEKQNLMSKHRSGSWDGNADLTFTVVSEKTQDGVDA